MQSLFEPNRFRNKNIRLFSESENFIFLKKEENTISTLTGAIYQMSTYTRWRMIWKMHILKTEIQSDNFLDYSSISLDIYLYKFCIRPLSRMKRSLWIWKKGKTHKKWALPVVFITSEFIFMICKTKNWVKEQSMRVIYKYLSVGVFEKDRFLLCRSK